MEVYSILHCGNAIDRTLLYYRKLIEACIYWIDTEAVCSGLIHIIISRADYSFTKYFATCVGAGSGGGAGRRAQFLRSERKGHHISVESKRYSLAIQKFPHYFYSLDATVFNLSIFSVGVKLGFQILYKLCACLWWLQFTAWTSKNQHGIQGVWLCIFRK